MARHSVDMHATGKNAPRGSCAYRLHARREIRRKSYKVSADCTASACPSSTPFRLARTRKSARWRGLGAATKRGKPSPAQTNRERRAKTGTKVTFHPRSLDLRRSHQLDTAGHAPGANSLPDKGLKITLNDERTDKEPEFAFTGGIAEFVKHLNRGRPRCTIRPSIWKVSGQRGDRNCPAIQRHLRRERLCVATRSTPWMAATHLRLPLGAYAFDQQLCFLGRNAEGAKGRGEHLGDDVREGLVAVVSVRLPQPQFEGQTKGKRTATIKGDVEQLVNGNWASGLTSIPPWRGGIIGKCIDATRACEAPARPAN